MLSLQFINLQDQFKICFGVTLILFSLGKQNHYITLKRKTLIICLLAYLYILVPHPVYFFDVIKQIDKIPK